MIRNATKYVSVPATGLVRRADNQATALHLAAAVPHNLPCVQLLASRPPCAPASGTPLGCIPPQAVIPAVR